TIRNAKLFAAISPILLLSLAPAGWIIAHQPLQGTIIVVIWLLAILSAALIQLWHGKPGTRGAFKTRSQGSFLAALLNLTC
ncbi:hypothetical protein MMA63_24030, partial [Salmonella enterica]|nr:hypothetical protein [Salmonella enterica]